MAKTIAFYISSLRKGGAERVIVNLAEYFCREGYQVLVVTTRKEKTEYALPTGVLRTISEPAESELTGSRVNNFKKRFGKLRGIWKEAKPDIIISFIGKNNMMALLTSRGLNIPVVVSVRGDPEEEYYNFGMRFMARNLFKIADGVILQTKRCFSFFPARVRDRAVILKNPVNPLFFRERYEGERDRTIIAVGRVDENKNHEMLIRAFAPLSEQFPDYTLIIYGEGEKREELKELVKRSGLCGRVQLPGNIDDVADAIYRARVFVLSSDTEGMPNTLIEAMAMGLTVVSTDCPCGGPGELIRHMTNGLLTPVGDVNKMRENLQFLLENPQTADELGIHAKKTSDIYLPEKVCREWREYTEGLMRRKCKCAE